MLRAMLLSLQIDTSTQGKFLTMTDAYQLTGEGWKNRIVGYGVINPEDLLANPFNFRVHPKEQQDALASALNHVGWVQDVIVNTTTGHVVDGHLRVALALRKKEPNVPVKYVELSEEEEKLVLAYFDYITGRAVIDADILDTLLQQVEAPDSEIGKMLSDLAEAAGLYGDEPAEPAEEEYQEQWMIIVECTNENDQLELLHELDHRGMKCRALVS